MIERIIKNEPLPYNNFLHVKEVKASLFEMIKAKFNVVEEAFGIEIPDTELAYIVEMIDAHFGPMTMGEDFHLVEVGL